MLWSTCPECGGILEPITKPGRIGPYRGKPKFTIPSDMTVPTCHKCGAMWFDHGMIDKLQEEFECQRLMMLHRDSQF